MTPDEIQERLVAGCAAYYELMEEKGRGIAEIEVRSIIPSRDMRGAYTLRLAQKLFDADSIQYRDLTEGKVYEADAVSVVEYDADRNTLIVRPGASAQHLFSLRQADEIAVISDLKFLIERLQNWYEENGGELALPEEKPVLHELAENLAFDGPVQPSASQQAAIKAVLTTPFSYIWGAPGTGKTQFVLAYTLVKYLEAGKRAAIFAPTNNALEQVLRGVVKMTDAAGIPRSKILRLGSPTRRFAAAFPEMCETRGLLKRVQEIDKQIEIQESVLAREEKAAELHRVKQALAMFPELQRMRDRHKQLRKEIKMEKAALLSLRTKAANAERAVDDAKKRLLELQERRESLLGRVTRIFAGENADLDREITAAAAVIDAALAAYSKITAACTAKELEIVSLQAERKDNGPANRVFAQIRELCTGAATEIVAGIGRRNYRKKAKALQAHLEAAEKEIALAGARSEEYSLFPEAEIRGNIAQLHKQRELLEERSGEAAGGAAIIACTLDTYVYRYLRNEIKADHFFLDEAGYANVMKALPLFRSGKPVTFLGDHKQLPPVCEANRLDILKQAGFKNLFFWDQSAIHLEDIFSKDFEGAFAAYERLDPPAFQQMARLNLAESFRFGNRLAQVLARHVYGDHFGSASETGETDIFFIHASKSGIPAKKRENEAEARAIQLLVERHSEKLGEFVILTPYRDQLNLIGKFLPHVYNDLRILTVHGSQGREWETVILSISDTDNKFFTDSRRAYTQGLNLLNTAVSRARKRLIIACDYAYWSIQNGQLLRDLILAGQPIRLVGVARPPE